MYPKWHVHDETTVIVCPTDRHWWYDGVRQIQLHWEMLHRRFQIWLWWKVRGSSWSCRHFLLSWVCKARGHSYLGRSPTRRLFQPIVLRTSRGFLVHPPLLIRLQNRVSTFIIAPLRTSFVLVYLLLYTATTGKEMRQCREEKHASTIPTILRCFEHPSGYLNSKDIIHHHVQMQITLKKFRDNRLPCWIFEVHCVTLGISSKSWWSDFSNEHFLLMQRTRWSAWLRASLQQIEIHG